jgi:hypothetical protein
MDEILAAGLKAVCSLILAIVTMLIAPGTMRAQYGTDPYPFAVGNYWIYRGYVTRPAIYDQGHFSPPETKERAWRSEITQVVYRNDGSAAMGALLSRISAAVFDDTVGPASERFPVVLINVNSDRFYEIPDPGLSNGASAIPDILRRVRDANDDLSDLFRNSLILDLPLSPGKHWGAPFYSWTVIQVESNPLIGLRGSDANLNNAGFVLETSDNTGTKRVTFVPGVGITHVWEESLFPRGDPNHRELDARLVEVHLKPTTAPVAR